MSETLQKLAHRIPCVVFEFRLDANGHATLPYVTQQLWEYCGVYPETVKDDAGAFFKRVHAEDREPLLASLDASAENLSLWDHSFRVRNVVDDYIWARVEAFPQKITGGGTVWMGYLRDISVEVETRQNLIELQQRQEFERTRFELVMQGSSDGFWDWDIESGAVFYTKRNFELLGLPERHGDQFYTWWRNRLHPDDLPIIEERIERHLKERIPYDITYRIRHRNHQWRWWRSKGQAVWDTFGQPVRMVGSNSDVTTLREAVESAEEAVQSKDRFLAVMSHELRTPLNGLLGMLTALEKTTLDPRQSRLVAVARDGGSSLLTIINDILDLTKLESGKLELEILPFGMGELAQSVQALHEPTAHAKNITLRLELDAPAELRRMGDANRVRQILHNLVSNAVKFTETGGVVMSVHVIADDSAEYVTIAVSDSGIGMTDAQAAKVFDDYVQADSSTARRFGGTGLGLSIVKALVEIMDGTISLETSEGEGSTFTVRLPLPQLTEDVTGFDASDDDEDLQGPYCPVPEITLEHVAQTTTHVVTPQETPTLAGPPKEAEAHTPPALVADDALTEGDGEAEEYEGEDDEALHVLVAEDNPLNRAVLETLLEPFDMNLHFEENGRLAFEAYKIADYDIVLMDIQMPEMDGINAYKAIRAHEEETGRVRTPILALTANAMRHHLEEYAEVGFDTVVSKPVDVAVLVEAMSECLAAAAEAEADADAA